MYTTNLMNSDAFWKQCEEFLPGGVNSPIRSGYGIGIRPPMMVRGEGSRIIDADGNQYIDCCMSWGALLHGHAHPKIVEAATRALQAGSSFGMTTPVEGVLAETICHAIPSIEKIRFVSTGTESTMSAVRLARAHTGRQLCVTCYGHYHGHADQFLVNAGSGVAILPGACSAGIPDNFISSTLSIPFNDIPALENVFATHGADIAAVILEPVAANMGVTMPDISFLTRLREITQQAGALLIFDEVITGFRVGYSGAQGLFGIRPDLTCLGKIIGGGLPAAAFGGRRDIMDLLAPKGRVYQAGTLSGNPVAMHAGLAALTMASEDGFYDRMSLKMQQLSSLDLTQRGAHIGFCGSMWTLFFHGENAKSRYARLFVHMLRSGVFIPPAQNEACFLSSVHSDIDVKRICGALRSYLEIPF